MLFMGWNLLLSLFRDYGFVVTVWGFCFCLVLVVDSVLLFEIG